MKNLRPFQIVLLAVFSVMALIALVLIGDYRPGETEEEQLYGSQVIIWGSLPAEAFTPVFNTLKDQNDNFKVVRYVEVDERNFNANLVNAIAEGRSPDLIVLPHQQLVGLRAKLLPIPYENISERQFRDSYIDGAEIFALRDGIYAFPFVVDPVIMYWNRDLFSGAGLAQPPTTWESLVGNVVPALTRRDSNRSILQSAIAFGEYRNVRNAAEVFAMLLLQSGSRMVEEGDRGYVVALNQGQQSSRAPMDAALQFYTDFANANSPAYSWNRALAEDRSAFVAGDLALYFGLGSEVGLISDRNPNLNFDAALVPQGANATIRRTYGNFYGFAIPRASSNVSGAYAAGQTLSQAEVSLALSRELQMAPVHRSILGRGSNSAFEQIIFNAALISAGWLDPNPASTDGILQTMVEDVASNRARISEASGDAVDRITLSF